MQGLVSRLGSRQVSQRGGRDEGERLSTPRATSEEVLGSTLGANYGFCDVRLMQRAVGRPVGLASHALGVGGENFEDFIELLEFSTERAE